VRFILKLTKACFCILNFFPGFLKLFLQLRGLFASMRAFAAPLNNFPLSFFYIVICFFYLFLSIDGQSPTVLKN